MKVIWKFQTYDPTGRIQMPAGANILKVGFQRQRDIIRERDVMQFCLWAMVETENEKVTRVFGSLPTGVEWPDNYRYIDSILDHPSGLIYHAFEDTNGS